MPNSEGFLIVERDSQVSVKGKRVMITNACSLAVIERCLNEAKAVFIHTEIPVVFRMCKMPDLIQTLLFKGKKHGSKNAKKAS